MYETFSRKRSTFAYRNVHFCYIFQKQDMKLQNSLWSKYGESLDGRSLTICSGTDYINVNYQHIVCPDEETAKVSVLFGLFHKLL